MRAYKQALIELHPTIVLLPIKRNNLGAALPKS